MDRVGTDAMLAAPAGVPAGASAGLSLGPAAGGERCS